MHTARFLFDFFAHASNAFASFCARVNDFDLTAGFEAAGEVRLPAPENVALGGAPKIAGWGEGAGLHESPVLHGGGTTGGGTKHGAASEQT